MIVCFINGSETCRTYFSIRIIFRNLKIGEEQIWRQLFAASECASFKYTENVENTSTVRRLLQYLELTINEVFHFGHF